MRSTCLAVAALILLTFGPRPIAQRLPDFSGTWVEDEAARKTTFPAAEAGAQAIAAAAADTVVTQTATTLTVERTVMSQVLRYVFDLSGKESVNRNGANTLTTRSYWEGHKLVSRGTSFSVTSQGESTWEYTEIRSLDAKGTMIVDTRYKDEAGKVNVVSRIFRKKTTGR
jgi:hypothetical protein